MTSPWSAPSENRNPDSADEALATTALETLAPQLVSVPTAKPLLFVTVNARYTTVFWNVAGLPPHLRIVRHGAVALAMSQGAAARASAGAVSRMIRAAAQQVVERARLGEVRGFGGPVVGLADVARALVTLGASGRTSATAEQIRAATDTLAVAWADARKDAAAASWVEPMMVASAVLGAILEHVAAPEISLERAGDES